MGGYIPNELGDTEQIFAAAGIGGVSSFAAGGSFLHGAMAAGFGRAFNHVAHATFDAGNGAVAGQDHLLGDPQYENLDPGYIESTNDLELMLGGGSLLKSGASKLRFYGPGKGEIIFGVGSKQGKQFFRLDYKQGKRISTDLHYHRAPNMNKHRPIENGKINF